MRLRREGRSPARWPASSQCPELWRTRCSVPHRLQILSCAGQILQLPSEVHFLSAETSSPRRWGNGWPGLREGRLDLSAEPGRCNECGEQTGPHSSADPHCSNLFAAPALARSCPAGKSHSAHPSHDRLEWGLTELSNASNGATFPGMPATIDEPRLDCLRGQASPCLVSFRRPHARGHDAAPVRRNVTRCRLRGLLLATRKARRGGRKDA